MHYAAVGCDMATIRQFADVHNLLVIEDAAQCISANYHGQKLGTFGDMAAISFHHTKNVIAGQGGLLIINNEDFLDRAKVIWQKGTNREAFLEGRIDKYTWVDIGSSFLMSELNATLLLGQLMRLKEITQKRLAVWQQYHQAFEPLEQQGLLRRPIVPLGAEHNGHIYYLLLNTIDEAAALRSYLTTQGIEAPFHYVPLHLAPAGKQFAKICGKLPVCESLYQRIVRLPIWEGVAEHMEYIIEQVVRGIQQ